MPYIPTPYVPREYEPRQYERQTGRLSDLIRAQGAAQARGEREAAAISGQLGQSLGQQASGVLSQLAQYKMDAPKRQHEQMLRDEQARKVREEGNIRGLDQMAAGMTEDKRADLFDQAGYRDRAMEIRDRDRTRKAQEFDFTAKQLAQERQRLSETANILNEIEKAPIEERPARYAAIVGDLRKRVGPELAAKIGDNYDPAAVRGMIDTGKTIDDQIKWNQLAASEFSLSNAKAQGSRQAFEHEQKSALFALKAADTPEEWAKAWQMIDAHVKDESIKNMFSREFSPEAMQYVSDLSNAMNPDKTMTALDQEIAAFQRDNEGRLPNRRELTGIINDVTNATYRYNPLTGSAGRNGRLTSVQKNVVERWKESELAKAEKLFREGDIDEAGLGAEKERIQASYLMQLGMDEGPTAGQLAAQQGKDLMGRPIGVAPAAPPAAVPQSPASRQAAPAPPQAGRFPVQMPDGSTKYAPTREAAAAAQAQIDQLTKQSSQNSVPQSQPAPPAPAAASPQPQAPDRVLMQHVGTKRVQWVPGSEAAQREKSGDWKPIRQSSLADSAVGKEANAAWGRFKRDIKK